MAKDALKTRNITVLPGTGKTTLQLEPEAWILVDAVAKSRGQNWRDWVENEAISTPSEMSRAAWIRKRAMALFYDSVMRQRLQDELQERADALAGGDPFCNPELDAILAFLDDESVTENMDQCPIEGSVDLGGFILHVGFDEFRRRCFWVENQMKGGPSIAISIPAEENL